MIEELQGLEQDNQDMSVSVQALVNLDTTRMRTMYLETFLCGARVIIKANLANRQ
jgi:hypothetical protein